jgi:hypothetical protein
MVSVFASSFSTLFPSCCIPYANKVMLRCIYFVLLVEHMYTNLVVPNITNLLLSNSTIRKSKMSLWELRLGFDRAMILFRCSRVESYFFFLFPVSRSCSY